MSKTKSTLGTRVKELRDEYLLSQTDFGNHVGISYVALGKIERGETETPQKETINNIINKFGTSYDWLIEGKGDMLPTGKRDLTTPESGTSDPWKDEAYQNIKKERDNYWNLLQQFMQGKVSFLTLVKDAG